jgi:hypothetical protein
MKKGKQEERKKEIKREEDNGIEGKKHRNIKKQIRRKKDKNKQKRRQERKEDTNEKRGKK